MEHVTADIWLMILSGLKIITLAIGGTFVVYAARAWIKHRTRSMLLLTVAIGILTTGLFVEGAVFWLTASMDTAHLTEAAIALVGFSVLLASVITARTDGARRVPVAKTSEDEGEESGRSTRG